jgi:hypothetical protein
MSEKVEFSGDVGQAVMGDVKEAPRLSNVVNLNLSEVKKEVQLITDYQRKRINLLVKEWAAICGDKELDIYKVFIADFGLRKFRELPIEHYLPVKATLEGWIASGSKSPNPPAVSTVEPKTTPHAEHLHCLACVEKDTSFARAQRTNFAQWVLIGILAGSCAWLLYKMPTQHELDSLTGEHRCYFDGKEYSTGSTVRNVTGNLQECVADGATSLTKWDTVRRSR